MCTAVSFITKDHYFGRNLDFDFSYEENVTVMPRNYGLHFHNGVKWNCRQGGQKAENPLITL